LPEDARGGDVSHPVSHNSPPAWPWRVTITRLVEAGATGEVPY
jgi:hypothetical protein